MKYQISLIILMVVLTPLIFTWIYAIKDIYVNLANPRVLEIALLLTVISGMCIFNMMEDNK